MKQTKPKRRRRRLPKPRQGKVKYALLGWMIGLPLPIILLLLFYRGCDF